MRCLLSLLLFVLPVLGAALVTRQLIAEAPPPARRVARGQHDGLPVACGPFTARLGGNGRGAGPRGVRNKAGGFSQRVEKRAT